MGQLESCEHNEAKIRLLVKQLASLQLCDDFQTRSLNPREYFQSHLQPYKSTLKDN